LIVRWNELCRDQSLRDLPYRIELTASGKLEMSAMNVRRGILQAALTTQLKEQLPDGVVFMNCPVVTAIGVRVPSVAWASATFMATQGSSEVFKRAPDICAEIDEPDIEQKVPAYLGAGAKVILPLAMKGIQS
jgi:hypothetical protein